MKLIPWVLPVLLAHSAASIAAPHRFLTLGEQRSLNVPGLKKYARGGTCIAVGHPPGRSDHLLIRGARLGRCDLQIQSSDSGWQQETFEVVPSGAEGARDPGLLQALSGLREAEALPSGPRWVLRGEISTFEEAIKIRLLQEGWPDSVRSEIDLSPPLRAHAEHRLRLAIAQAGLQDSVELKLLPEGPVVEGAAPDEATQTRWRSLLLKAFPLASIRIQAFKEGDRTVHLQAYLISLKREESRELGFDWRDGPASLVRATLSGLQSELELNAHLRALESRGAAQLLSNPQLLMRVPGEAELFAGAELPIELKGRFYYEVQWKGFGLTLKLKALEATLREARLEISAEMSRLDDNLKIRDLPALQSNRMKTTVDAPFGRPILLSGLIQDERSSSNSGLPFLSRIPLLGLLFGAEAERNDHRELVAILLPERGVPRINVASVKRVFPRGLLPWARTPESAEHAEIQRDPEQIWKALETPEP